MAVNVGSVDSPRRAVDLRSRESLVPCPANTVQNFGSSEDESSEVDFLLVGGFLLKPISFLETFQLPILIFETLLCWA